MNTLGDVLQNCTYILPELILIVALVAVILADVMLPKEKSSQTGFIALAGLALALFVVVSGYGDHAPFATTQVDSAGEIQKELAGPQVAFSSMIVVDKLSDFFKTFILFGSILIVFFTRQSVEIRDYRYGEYYTLMLGAVLGGSFLVSSNNLIMFVLSLETLSLCSYVLVGYRKHDRLSAESSLKYILYGSVASGVMLFGISYLYGMAGTLDISQLFVGLAYGEDYPMAVMIAFILLLGGLAFKIAAVPFHFWAPDVYQGAPTPITAFLAVVSKAAGFGAAIRIFLPLFATEAAALPDAIVAVKGSLISAVEQSHLPLLFWILSAATMTLGNLVALRQTDIKRLFAYSSIAHAGYLLMGMTVLNESALEAMLFYFVVYLFMNLGAFLVIILMINRTGSAHIDTYKGLIYRNPAMAVIMVVFLLSLTGLPPTAGFVGKLKLFEAVISAGAANLGDQGTWTIGAGFYFSLALIAALNTVVSLYYYWKIAKYMVLDPPVEEGKVSLGIFDTVSLYAYCFPVLFLIFLPFGPLISMLRIFGN